MMMKVNAEAQRALPARSDYLPAGMPRYLSRLEHLLGKEEVGGSIPLLGFLT